MLEDVARLLLDDPILTQHFRSLRHQLSGAFPDRNLDLLSARGADRDVGASLEPSSLDQYANALEMVAANAKRAQEALRVLEEVSKLEGGPRPFFAEARFSLYTLERELTSRILRGEKAKQVCGLYAIIDWGAARGRELLLAREVIAGGASAIQLRYKGAKKGEVLPLGQELRRLSAEAGVLFLVNDHLDLALALGADGVHLGQADLPISAARKMLPINRLLGCSVATLEEALKAQSEGADYLGVGSIYPTASKEDIRLVGLEGLRQIASAVSIPVVAIGGINLDNVRAVVEAGAEGVAVISALTAAPDPRATARALVEAVTPTTSDQSAERGEGNKSDA